MKRIICIRHSISECNEALHTLPWGSPNFKDPMLWDTILSPAGITKAQSVHEKLRAKKLKIDLNSVELVCSSPLTRALHTGEILLSNGVLPSGVPKVALPLLRERLYLASDVGQPRSVLEDKWSEWSFDMLPVDDSPWWHVSPTQEWRPKGTYPCPGEPQSIWHARIEATKKWILARDEGVVLLVGHWGLFRGLFGINAENCGIYDLSSEDLLAAPPSDC